VNFTNSCTIGSGVISTYQWIFGDGSPADYSSAPTHCYQTGNYNVTLKAVSDSGCVASSTLPTLVNVYPTPIADFNVTPTTVDVTAPLIEVTDKSIGASSVKYIFSDGTIKNVPNFSHFFVTDNAKTILIMQKVVNTYGCRDSIVKVLDIKPAYVLYIPNAFTPNSDGLNDGFKALGMGIKDFKLQIFDRWGEMVFESDDINKAWDGTINGKGDYESTKEDVYVWKVQVKDVLSKQHDLIGHVTLVK
jgi:gliding motility-associated-like protein